MKQVVNMYKKNDGQKRLGVIRLELDYELATLYEAMVENNEEKKNQCKQKLEKLRQEMIALQ
ncbi:hypothetical protein CHN50_10790 [Priestia aryabhattai]|uniref:hypothetical protein n=1 Tax=Bacillaceae TaxID=186817 RepID=UPI000BA0AF29|nr:MULTISPECIES: hypothetical protein [Bacillaceae]MDT2047493.1 hypothetical protein [Priestia flexa]OZT12391.1 hypothetical protein CHN50_10790 [Priestia aryabhattai]TDB55233.1 hypothetical protein EPL02_03255 [Bacillus sp. CBEL-1]USY56386.1 hypothetical protein NIZ91_06955 [Bacillus sp. 1780r2a1]